MASWAQGTGAEIQRTKLVCVECGQTVGSAPGWRAYLTDDDRVAVYCPDCAEHALGPLRHPNG